MDYGYGASTASQPQIDFGYGFSVYFGVRFFRVCVDAAAAADAD
jgi:hypothetical protein